MKQFCVSIMASQRNGTLYTGVTSDLLKRVYEHKNGIAEGFRKRYHVHCLVWCELHHMSKTAISREKQIKKWNRVWKMGLIERTALSGKISLLK